MNETLGFVVIGRNEGDRLAECLRSLPKGAPAVYVDSGSSDGSPKRARDLGAEVVELTTDKPFSAARGRNEGFDRLTELHPDLTYVHFIDGDCELYRAWIEVGIARLEAEPRLAVVAGQRLERFPEKSLYNGLCAEEWNTPVGPATAVGGDAIYRVEAFREVQGFDPLMMAGEEPELCFRLSANNWTMERVDARMTLHDAQILTFDGWWKRAVRSGYAYMLGAMKHPGARYNFKPVIRSLLWGGALPFFALITLATGRWWIAAGIVALYGLKWLRIRQREQRREEPGRYAGYMMLVNVAEVLGIAQATWQRLSGRFKIIEYKKGAA